MLVLLQLTLDTRGKCLLYAMTQEPVHPGALSAASLTLELRRAASEARQAAAEGVLGAGAKGAPLPHESRGDANDTAALSEQLAQGLQHADHVEAGLEAIRVDIGSLDMLVLPVLQENAQRLEELFDALESLDADVLPKVRFRAAWRRQTPRPSSSGALAVPWHS